MSRAIALGLAVALACISTTQAQVVVKTVTVGNPGNDGENSGESEPGGYGPDRICGAVEYLYGIGKFEVTAGQYAEFLNAVAKTDTHGLYNTFMWTNTYGCKIRRTEESPYYSYSVAGDWADRPVNYVSWGDAARFANWLHNGQPTGAQGPGTTEDGSYFLDGAMSDAALLAVVREPDATWVIPSEDEWYKAAYHYNDGATGNYYDYPISSDSVPSNDLIDPDPGNNANFYDYLDGYTIGSPYYRTVVGDFENSDSPYGTFDQGGNVWEYNETVFLDSYRGLRGGAFSSSVVRALLAAGRTGSFPTDEYATIGFRIADLSGLPPPAPPEGEPGYDKIKYISFVPSKPGLRTAIRVTLTTMPPPYGGFSGQQMWVGPAVTKCENGGLADPPCPQVPLVPDDFQAANLQCTPNCMDYGSVGVIHVTDDEIIPGTVYDVQAIDCECDFGDEANYSDPLTIGTTLWGDLVGNCTVTPCTPPDGIVNVTTDVTAVLDKFKNLPIAVMKARADLDPNKPDWLVNITDVTVCLDAFLGFTYPPTGWAGPGGCP